MRLQQRQGRANMRAGQKAAARGRVALGVGFNHEETFPGLQPKLVLSNSCTTRILPS